MTCRAPGRLSAIFSLGSHTCTKFSFLRRQRAMMKPIGSQSTKLSRETTRCSGRYPRMGPRATPFTGPGFLCTEANRPQVSLPTLHGPCRGRPTCGAQPSQNNNLRTKGLFPLWGSEAAKSYTLAAARRELPTENPLAGRNLSGHAVNFEGLRTSPELFSCGPGTFMHGFLPSHKTKTHLLQLATRRTAQPGTQTRAAVIWRVSDREKRQSVFVVSTRSTGDSLYEPSNQHTHRPCTSLHVASDPELSNRSHKRSTLPFHLR